MTASRTLVTDPPVGAVHRLQEPHDTTPFPVL